MQFHPYMVYLRKEHEELSHLADKIERSLEIASTHDSSRHQKILNELRGLEHGMTGIVEHCHAADRLVESELYKDLPAEKLARIAREHLRIKEAIGSFREELKFATPDRTMAMILPGMDVVKLLRDHIAFENGVFGRARRNEGPRGISAAAKKGGRRAAIKKRVSAREAKRKAPGTPDSMVPYTLESHPEL